MKQSLMQVLVSTR